MTQAAISAALSVVLGAALGAFYDVIRFLRVVLGVDVKSPFIKGNKSLSVWLGYLFVCLSDFLFFAVAAALFCVFFFLTGDGRMRGYALFGGLSGFLIYYNTVGRLFIGAVTYIVRMIKRALRLLFVPFAKIYGQIKKLYSHFLSLPIVKAAFTRYNDYISAKKKKAAAQKRRKKAKKGGYCANGGTHGQ